MVQFDRLPRMNWSHQIVRLIVWEPPQGQRQPMRGRQEIDRASMSFEILMISDCTWLYLFINLWNADVRCYDCMWHYLIELTHNYNHVKNQSNQYTPKNQINLKPTSTKSMKTGRSQRRCHLQLGQAEKANSDIIFYYFNGYSFFGRKENSLNNQTNGYSLTCWKWWLDIREMLR